MPEDGFNPMRWNCRDKGCYNEILRPKIEVFASAFPRKIAMTDIDATVEINGHFLFFEFKDLRGHQPTQLPLGQRIYFTRLTSLHENITTVVIGGNIASMEFTHYCVIKGGVISPWKQTSLPRLLVLIEDWAKRVDIRIVEEKKTS